VDLTFASPQLARSMSWRVSDCYTASDHSALRALNTHERQSLAQETRRFRIHTLDQEKFLEELRGLSISENGDRKAAMVMQALNQACAASMTRRRTFRRHKQVYWWNDVIAKLRANCTRARRKFTLTACRSMPCENLSTGFATKRRAFCTEIRASKARCFRSSCDEGDRDPWGQAYKIVTN